MAIPWMSLKSLEKPFPVNTVGAMDENSKGRRENRKPPPEYVGGDQDLIAQSNLQGDLQNML